MKAALGLEGPLSESKLIHINRIQNGHSFCPKVVKIAKNSLKWQKVAKIAINWLGRF